VKLVVGLGNPGQAYRHTRHNLGFQVLDGLCDALSLSFSREKFRGQIAEGAVDGRKVLLLKPMTFMNKSGESVARAARNNVNDPGDVLVVYDDVDLPLGKIRLRKGGSPGTHNGMRSVLERLGTQEVPRLRIGVGEKAGGRDLADHVLSTFRPEEKPAVKEAVDQAVQACLSFLEEGVDTAMNRFN